MIEVPTRHVWSVEAPGGRQPICAVPQPATGIPQGRESREASASASPGGHDPLLGNRVLRHPPNHYHQLAHQNEEDIGNMEGEDKVGEVAVHF